LPRDFWSMSWEEIAAAGRGYETRLARHIELDRLIATVLINAYRKSGTRARTPEEIMTLITDRKMRTVELMSKEEFERTKELFARVKWPNQN